MKKPNETAEQQNGTITEFSVDHCRVTKAGVFFTLILNGVTINNCKVVEGKRGDFISLPQYKGTDGNWYSTVYFRFSAEDQNKIIDEVEKIINA